MKTKPASRATTVDVMSNPAGMPDANSLLGNLNSDSGIMNELNGMQKTGNVGRYVPTEFPLESKL